MTDIPEFTITKKDILDTLEAIDRILSTPQSNEELVAKANELKPHLIFFKETFEKNDITCFKSRWIDNGSGKKLHIIMD